ncbi:helix-turn-helix domain-containing protein [Micromonospora sp. B11E3]|uniref:helix-turn-helix domain-containing protein n=1 Tax=Micromonospora sp. B11E3 TaxID=3153562 RepID=UPI00325E5075
MSGVVERAFKYRFYPSPQQAEQLNRTFGCVRLVYNRALEARTRAWAVHLQAGFVAFWDRRARYPRFKSKRRSRASAEYTRSAFRGREGCRATEGIPALQGGGGCQCASSGMAAVVWW